jgi:hypothetical protein
MRHILSALPLPCILLGGLLIAIGSGALSPWSCSTCSTAARRAARTRSWCSSPWNSMLTRRARN